MGSLIADGDNKDTHFRLFIAADGDKLQLGSRRFTSGSQYMETSIFNDGNHVDNFNLGLSFAKEHVAQDHVEAVFVTDHQNGYLFADIDHNGLVDTAIELHGLSSITDFAWRNLV